MERIACLFPGQGSQYVGMGLKFFSFPAFKKTMETAFCFLGEDYRNVLIEGPLELLSETRYTQPLVYAVSYALYLTFVEHYTLEPAILTGHSLGEITALTCAGAIDFEDGLRIVKRRGELMTVGQAGGMAAVIGLKEDEVSDICRESTRDGECVVPANINSSSQIVVSGTTEALASVRRLTEERQGRFIPLKVSAPFHSPYMQPAADALKTELAKYSYQEPAIPVVSNVDARFYSSAAEIPDKLTEQLTSPVRWNRIMDLLERENITTCIEIGPKNILKGLMTAEKKHIVTCAADQEEDYRRLEILFYNYRQTLELCIKHAVTLRNNNPDPQAYEKAVRMPLKQILSGYYTLLDTGRNPDEEAVVDGLRMVMKVFEAKHVPVHERETRLDEIFRSLKNKTLVERLKAAEVGHE